MTGKGTLNLVLDASYELPQLFRTPLSKKKKFFIFLQFIKISFKLFTLHRIKKITKENFLGFSVYTFDYGALHYLFREIFVKNTYFTHNSDKKLKIFDCGANIGIATLYFKWLYPDAEIHAFEPDPVTFQLLEKNVSENKLKHIYLYNIALFDKKGKVKFYVDHNNPGWLTMSTIRKKLEGKDVIEVNANSLAKFLQKKTDLVKMDVEGAELKIIEDIVKKKKINLISEMVIEYHSDKNPKTLQQFTSLLSKAGYTIEISAEKNRRQDYYQDVIFHATR